MTESPLDKAMREAHSLPAAIKLALEARYDPDTADLAARMARGVPGGYDVVVNGKDRAPESS